MGSTIYSQKLTHPVQVSFICEHCGEYNSFTQNIIGTGSAEVAFSSSKKHTQNKVAKVGTAAQSNLERKIQKARSDTMKGKYSWLNHKRCSKCKYSQSWQISSIWQTFIGILFLYSLPVLLISVWIDFGRMNAAGWIFFIIFIGLILLPVVKLLISLIRMDRKKPNKPTVNI